MPSHTTTRFFPTAVWIIIAVISAYTIGITVSHYFEYTKESYTEYFWPRRNWLIIHILGGLTAILVGPFQFIKKIRTRNIKIHRLLGRIYLACIMVSAPVGFYLAATSKINFVYATGLSMLAITWFSMAAMAYISIHKRNITQHREWMTRSYVVTTAFTFFRIGLQISEALDVGTFEMRLALLSWACWSVPLFVSEILLQARKINTVKPTTVANRESEAQMERASISLMK